MDKQKLFSQLRGYPSDKIALSLKSPRIAAEKKEVALAILEERGHEYDPDTKKVTVSEGGQPITFTGEVKPSASKEGKKPTAKKAAAKKPTAKKAASKKAAPKKQPAKKGAAKPTAKKGASKKSDDEIREIIKPDYYDENLKSALTSKIKFKKETRVVKIPIEDIKVREGFNVRKEFGDIEELAADISQNGQQVPLIVDVTESGDVFLVDGERRLKAMQQISENIGSGVTAMARVNDPDTTEEERIIQMFSTNNGKDLTALEEADLYLRLYNLGWSQPKIAEKVGKSIATISGRIKLAKSSEEDKAAIKAGKKGKTDVVNKGRKSRKVKNIVYVKEGSFQHEVRNKKDAQKVIDLLTEYATFKNVENSLEIYIESGE